MYGGRLFPAMEESSSSLRITVWPDDRTGSIRNQAGNDGVITHVRRGRLPACPIICWKSCTFLGLLIRIASTFSKPGIGFGGQPGVGTVKLIRLLRMILSVPLPITTLVGISCRPRKLT